MSVEIRFEGMEQIAAKLQRLEDKRAFKAALQQAARYVRGKVARYPAKKSVPNPLLTEDSERGRRVRAGFFARLRDGQITVPYQRTGKLGQSWAVSTENSGMRAIVGTNIGYARLVQDAEKQASMMTAIGWQTAQAVQERENNTVLTMLKKAIDNEVNS